MAHHNNNGSSLTDLEHETETMRAKLVQTVDELHDRVSPQALKREAKDYVRQSGRSMLQSLENRAMENPVAAMAVMAGLAIPAVKIISNVPVPVLLMGAGLALSGRNSRQNATYRAYSEGSYRGESVGQKVADATSSAAEKARRLLHDAKDGVDDMGTSAKDKIKEQADAVRSMASDAVTSATAAASDISDRTTRAVARTQDQFVHTFERQPLLVSGIAFVLGGFLASLLPRSQSEDRLLGGISDQMKERAKDLASEEAGRLETVARDTISSVAADLREEGMTPDAARHAVRNAMDKAGSVLDEGLPARSSAPSGKRSL